MRYPQLLRAVTLCLLPVLPGIAVASEDALPTTLDYRDIFNLEYPANPQFIADSNNLVYERRSMDIMTDSTRSSLWLIDVASQQSIELLGAYDSVSQSTVSPDGKKIAFVQSHDQQPNLFVHHLDNGYTAKLAILPSSAGNLTWSHDSKALAFTMFTAATGQSLFTDMPKKPEGAKWADTATFIEQDRYRADGAGYLKPGYPQIYYLGIDGGTPLQLTSGAYPNSGSLSFSADNQHVYFAANRSKDFALSPLTSDIYKVHVRSREVVQVTDLAGPEQRPHISPNGKYLAFTHINDRKLSYQVTNLMVLDLSTGSMLNLTSGLDRSVGDFAWSADSKSLVFSYDDKGNTRLAKANMQSEILSFDITIGGQSIGRPYTSGEFALSHDGAIVFTQPNRSRPADLQLNDKGKTTQLTRLNDDALNHLTLANVESMTIKSSLDGREIDAWIAYPPNFDKKQRYPLILEIHGGPHTAYGPHFSAEIQLMAAKGYVVVWSNPRGSSSYGEEFANTIHHNYPSNDYNDLMDVVDATVSKGFIDENNLFITGGSGGGVLTAWSIGKTDRFAAAVVAKPVINWLSFALTADAYPYFSQYWMEAMPWEISDKLWQRSPLSLVGNVVTPTLLLTGEADYRTPISESEQYYQALRLRGVDSAMVRIPGASHGIASRPSRLIQKVGNIVAWFERYRR